MFRTIACWSRLMRRIEITSVNRLGQFQFPRLIDLQNSRLITNESSEIYQELGNFSKAEKSFADASSRRQPLRDDIAKIITSCGNNINWNQVLAKSMEAGLEYNADREIVKGEIVRVCEAENLFDALTSYLKYLLKNNELCAGMLYIICDVVTRNREHLGSCEAIIYKIFLKLPPVFVIPLKTCASVLLTSPQYRDKVLAAYDTHLCKVQNHTNVVKSSLYQDDEKTALHYFTLCTPELKKTLVPVFLRYFQRKAEEGVVPLTTFVTVFDDLTSVDEEEKQVSNIGTDVINLFGELFAELNKIDKSHEWIMKTTEVSSDTCKTCKKKLRKTDVSEEEIRVFKEHFLKNVIVNENINIKSNAEEWDSFIQILQKKPYDIVLDTLNLVHGGNKNPRIFAKTLSEIEKLELTPLVLGRKHFKTFPEAKYVINKYPIFLTDNLSHDDVFVLYAALEKGKNCYAVSGDRMGFARSMLKSEKMKNIFLRWQATHQCHTMYPGRLILPRGYLPGYQKAPSRKDEFQYHLISNKGSDTEIYCMARVKK